MKYSMTADVPQEAVNMETEVNTLVKYLYAMKEMINLRDLALFIVPEKIRRQHHTPIGQKL